MILKNLITGKLIKRYKRFLADILLDSGETIVAHVPNSGSMKSLLIPEGKVWLTHNDNPKRKLRYTLELMKTKTGGIACVNTQLPNRIVEEAILQGDIEEFLNPKLLKAEVPYGNERSRIDLYIDNNNEDSSDNSLISYIEIKNVTLMEDDAIGVAQFPDSVTTRGQKHLRELKLMTDKGFNSYIFYLLNRDDCRDFKIASHIDSQYDKLYEDIKKSKVHILCYRTQFRFYDDCCEIKVVAKV